MAEGMDWGPIPRCDDGPGQHAMLMIAIDNLLPLEQLFGTGLASDILKVVDHRLSRLLPRIGQMWRPEHRRFAIVVPGMTEEGARSLANIIQTEIAREQIETASGPVAVTASIGCAVIDNAAIARLGPMANDALIEAMSEGVGSVRVACDSDEIAEHRSKLLGIAQTTMRALGAGQLTIAYQPVVASTGSRTVAFHECLARIRLDTGRVLSAGEFMPAVERLGLATIIDRQILGMALETLKKHRAARLSINLFPQSMQDAEWMALFRNAVREDPDLAERLIIEVTETGAVLDVARTRKFIGHLRDLGVAFALDDFGSGHTSFGHLRDFRFDMIKIDSAFIKDIGSNPDNRFFVKTLVAIAERFEMMTVAEAVQNAHDAQILADLDVGYFQGFFFGTPGFVLEPMPEPAQVLRDSATAL
ncbi:MAG: GGDEF domain-containing phosphodiesterase [Pseudomonadota bacterium]